jgi:hypothetical protein
MPGDPRLRASDADRERTAQLLREHHAVGRLTAEEFEGRLEQVFHAKTLGELDALLADLPAIDLYQLPSAGIRPRRGGSGPRGLGLEPLAVGGLLPARDVPGIAWTSATALAVVLWVVIAVLAGGAAAWIPWFLLVIIPWRLILMRRRREP